MEINIVLGLPYVKTTIIFKGKELILEKVILDTGSSSSVFKADSMSTIDLLLEPNDPIHRICGVGGSEFVFTKQVDKLQIGNLEVADFKIEIGAMDYGFDIDGIIGMNFLIEVKAVIDLSKLEISFQENS